MDRICFWSKGMFCEFIPNSKTLVFGGETYSYPIRWNTPGGRLYVLFSTDCNLRCPYCFQNNAVRCERSVDDNQTILYISELQNRVNEIVLFGGEPFLTNNYNRVRAVLERFDYLKFIAFTNGNFEPLYCDLLKEFSYCFRSVIITMDGPKSIHNKRRFNPKQDSYDLIINNLRTISDYGIVVNVQINVDKYNADYIGQLLEELYSYEEFRNHQFTLNPVKYIANAIESPQLFELYFSLKRKYPLNLSVNNRLVGNLTKLFDMRPLNKDRCGLAKTYVLNLPAGNIYACPQNATSEIGTLSETAHIDTSSLNDLFLQTAYEYGKCKNCEYAFLCPYGCPYVETPADCKERVKRDLSLVLELMFNSPFSTGVAGLENIGARE